MRLRTKFACSAAAWRVLATLVLMPCAHGGTNTYAGNTKIGGGTLVIGGGTITIGGGITHPPSGLPYVYWQRLAGDPGTSTLGTLTSVTGSFGNGTIQLTSGTGSLGNGATVLTSGTGTFGNGTISLIGPTHASGSADGVGSEARFKNPGGVAVSELGELFISDSANHTIRKIVGGNVTTLAGTVGIAGTQNGIGTAAQFNNPQGLVVAKNGDVFVAEMGSHRIRKISPNGAVAGWAGDPGQPGGVNGAGAAARFNKPTDVAVDAAGNIYVADSGNHVIRKISAAGLVSTLAGKMGSPGSQDGLGGAALFHSPEGIAVDAKGNVFVADTANGLIRKINPSGMVSTVAGIPYTGLEPPLGRENVAASTNPGTSDTLKFPTDIEVDVLGNLYVSDLGSRTILKIIPSGSLSNLGLEGQPGGLAVAGIGGPSPAYAYPAPVDLAVSTNGLLYVADAGYHWIRAGRWANVRDIAPYFVTQPLSTAGFFGESVWLTATALATTDSNGPSGSVTYKWFCNGRQIPSSGSGYLQIKVSPSTIGSYHVVASNDLGFATSSKAELSLKPAAEWEWSAPTADQRIPQGGNVTFGVKNVTGPGVIRYQWLKDGRPIAGGTFSQLNLVGADISAAGLYTLDITTSAGKVTTASRRLIVEDPGLLIYNIKGTGNTATSPGKKSFSFGGVFLIDRTAQKSAFLWQDAVSKTYSIEYRADLSAHSTGPSVGTTSLFMATASNGIHPDTENETIWLAGTDALISLGGNPLLRTLAPETLIGQLNSLTLDQGATIQTQSATLTLDKNATLRARQLRESLEATLDKMKSELAAKGFVEITP